jgi:hypothetical protein
MDILLSLQFSYLIADTILIISMSRVSWNIHPRAFWSLKIQEKLCSVETGPGASSFLALSQSEHLLCLLILKLMPEKYYD